ncbi:putative non-specific serine/threonine protein kinase [Helianthus anomalus]
MSGDGHTFYSYPFPFNNSTSFSTLSVFAITPETPLYTFHYMTFAIGPSKSVMNAYSAEHLGGFNCTNDGNASNHVVAIELSTFKNLELSDIDNNNVGLDINSVVSVFATTDYKTKMGFLKT